MSYQRVETAIAAAATVALDAMRLEPQVYFLPFIYYTYNYFSYLQMEAWVNEGLRCITSRALRYVFFLYILLY